MKVKRKRLLTEVIFPSNLTLSEQQGTDGEKKWYLKGEFGVVDRPTDNKRIYPREVMEREINRLRKDIEAGRLFGEADHPEDGKTSLNRVSHLITDLRIEGDKIIGEAVLLDTIPGKNIKAILAAGGQIGASSRGWGDTVEDKDGNQLVKSDYQLITFDFVANPSARAYPELVVEELEEDDEDKEDKSMNLEELKEKYPDLIKELEHQIIDRLTQEQRVYEQAQIEDKVSEIKNRVEDLVKENQEKDQQIKELTEVVKKLGFELFLERNWGKHPGFQKIKELVGDLTVYSSIDEIKAKVDSALPLINEYYKDTEIATESVDAKRLYRQLKQIKEGVSRMKIKIIRHKKRAEILEMANKKLHEATEKAIGLANKLALYAYAHKKLLFHPNAIEISEMLENMNLNSKEQIDRLLNETRKTLREQREDVVKKGVGKDLNEDISPNPRIWEEGGEIEIDGETKLNVEDLFRLGGL